MSQRPFCSLCLLIFLFSFLGATAQPSLQFSTVSATCHSSNGKMVIKMSGDNPPYQVTLTGGIPLGVYTVNTNTDSAVFTGLPAGPYSVVVTDQAGKSTSQSAGALGDLVAPTITALNPAVDATCLNNDGQIAVTLSGGGGTPYTFLYNGEVVGKSTLLTDPQTDTAKGLPTGSVTLVIQDVNGCTTSGATVVGFDGNASLSVPPSYTICQGTDTTLSVTTNCTSFTWRPATGLSSTTVQNPKASPTTTTSYTVVGRVGICTSDLEEVTVTVLPAPVASVSESVDTTCYGKSTELFGNGGGDYQWTPAVGLSNAKVADPVVIAPTSTITYSLQVTDGNGCRSLSPAKVLVYVRPSYKVFAGNDTSVMVGQTVPLDAVDVSTIGFSAYSWTPLSGLSNAFSADPTASFSAIGDYTYVVTATAPDGCTASDSVMIKVYALADIFVPNAFTPNHDGHNDVLRALPVSMRSFKYLTVFDRWGQQVFTTNNPGIGWDGTFNGHEMSPGTYVWMAGGVDYMGRVVERKGTVILIR